MKGLIFTNRTVPGTEELVQQQEQGPDMNAHSHDVMHHEVPSMAQPHLIEVNILHPSQIVPVDQPQVVPIEIAHNIEQQNQHHNNQNQINVAQHNGPPPQQNQPQHQQQQQQQTTQNQQNSSSTQSASQKEEKKTKNDKKKKEAIDGQAREIIFKVIKFFESEKQNRGYAYPVENVVKRACAATGLSESTIKRIKRDGLRAEATQTRMTGPKKKRVRKCKVQLDYFQLCALRGIVNDYSVRKEVPTLGKILAAAKHELNYTGGKESLRLILLNKLGIKFKKCEKKNKKPPEPEQQPMQQQQPMQNIMPPPPPLQHMKMMENQCVYTNMLPPVSY